jgi:ubiquinone/menaquinone biosynthesis C-methylase UbiE
MSNRFYDAGAAGYDQIFGFASREFVPTLLRLARLAPGHRVLDVATGTGIAAEAATEVIGPMGIVIAADISVPMLDQARKRLSGLSNVFLCRRKWSGADPSLMRTSTQSCAVWG